MRTSDAQTADTVRYRMTRLQQIPVYFPLVLMLAEWSITTQDAGHWLVIVPALALITVPIVGLTNAAGIELTAHEAIVRRLGRRRIPWADVECIQIERRFGTRVIAIYEVSGRRTALRAPATGILQRDRQFEEKFQTIGRWWLEHRGAGAYTDAAAAGRGRVDWDSSVAWSRRARIRPAFVQIGPILMVLLGLFVETSAGVFGHPDHAGWPGLVGAVVGGLVLLAILTALWHFCLHAGVTFTDEALKVHNPRPCTIRWAEITSIAVERTWHGVRVVVHDGSGKATRLSGPRIGILLWDPDFAGKARAVHARWQAALGRPGASVLDLSAVRKPALWRQVLVALACAGLGLELLIGMLIAGLALAG